MTIILTGGGSGGHITPLIAIADEIKRVSPDVSVVFMGQKSDRFGKRLDSEGSIDKVFFISAGKFRRYHGALWRQVLDVKTVLLNLRDVFRFLVGIIQALRLLGMIKPDVVFVKGGYVGVPVGFAAALRRIPYITHDSDAIPGLANRLIARWASLHAVALPPSEYKNYPKDKTISVGIPIRSGFTKVTEADQSKAKKSLGYKKQDKLILVTGGGLGADRLNRIVIAAAPKLLSEFPDLFLVHQAGEKLADKVRLKYEKLLTSQDSKRVGVLGFCSEINNYSTAADVIITRAGATSLAEYGVQGKACIVIPNQELTGGHQVKNAAALKNLGAVLVVEEGDDAADNLMKVAEELLTDLSERVKLGKNISGSYVSNAAAKIAELIVGWPK